MPTRRSTHAFACDRALKRELVEHCSHPEILLEIIQRADRLAFMAPRSEARDQAIYALAEFWNAQPCILWTPPHDEHSRHLTVRIYKHGTAVISITRVIWACVHVVPEQGPQLEADEDLLHSCGNVPHKNTGWNACLNPGHLVRVPAMDRVTDVAAYPLHEQGEEAHHKRRMGLGVTGLANALEALGHAYGSDEFLVEMTRVLITIRDEAYRASALLAAERGPFPLFRRDEYLAAPFVMGLPDEVRNLIAKHGIRNSHLLSIAPTGTISLCADNVSSGIEPVFAYETDRKIMAFEGERLLTVKDYGHRFLGVEGKLSADVTVDEHLRVLTCAQRYVDSSVSKTCNVPAGTSWDDFKAIYVRAWKGGAKGCTTFQVGGRRQPVMEATCRIDEQGRKECE